MKLLQFATIIAITQLHCVICTLTANKVQTNVQELLDNDIDSYEEFSLEADDDVENLKEYEPNWDSLDARPIPDWYDKAKFGIFIHWGVFSVPGFRNEWFWNYWKDRGDKSCIDFMKKYYPPHFLYQDFAREFRAEFYDPQQWAETFKKAGAKYVVLTSKHHEGYTMWPSKTSFGWNSRDVGPGRDLVGELANAIRKTDIRFGLYHSLYEWYNPLYLSDQRNKFKTNDFVTSKTMPELYEIVNNYKPEIVWSDGDWVAPDTYWKSTEFIAWLYNSSPVKETVVTNDRWGSKTACHHGGIYTCGDNFNPGVLQSHKWENCMSMDKHSWGYRRNGRVDEYRTIEELLTALVTAVSCGGNLLLNVGPTKEGTLIPLQEERLLQIGSWLEVNGEAIYESTPWKFQNDTVTSSVWYTQNTERELVYAITLKWPGQSLHLGAVEFELVSKVNILGTSHAIKWSKSSSGGTLIEFPESKDINSNCAWTVVLDLKSRDDDDLFR